MKFCKLFDIDEYQVLYRLEIDSDNDNDTIITTTVWVDGVEANAKHKGFANSTAKEKLQLITEGDAKKHLEGILALLKPVNNIEVNNPSTV